jgi:hypothetical protein
MRRKRIEAIRVWREKTGWCVPFVILNVALIFDETVNVMMTSDKDLALLLQSWQKKSWFAPIDLQQWPGMSLPLMFDVFEDVYKLRCKKICPGISGCSFDFLKNYCTFYKTTGVGVVDCKVGDEYHVVMFKTNKTRRAVIFADTGCNSRKRGWEKYARCLVVKGVYLVRPHPCCPTNARYPCVSCQAEWPKTRLPRTPATPRPGSCGASDINV